MSGPHAWTALVQPAVDVLVKLLDDVIVKGRQTMVGGVVELMGHLVEAEAAVNAAGNSMAHGEKVSFNLPTLFRPLAQSWLSSQLPTFTGIIHRSVASDSLADPASENVQHSESVLAVLKCAHSIAKSVLDMPIKIPLLVPELIQTLHAGLHLYAYLISYPVIASSGSSSSSSAGSVSVATIVIRINNLMQIQREWTSMRQSIVDRSLAFCPKLSYLNLGTRRIDALWLSRLCKALARHVIVAELPWGAAYLPVARACPLTSGVIPGLEAALDALNDLVDKQAHSAMFSALCRATLAAWFSTLWSPPRVYLDTDYDLILEADLNALTATLTKYSAHILSTSVGREAMAKLDKTQREMNALMPLPSRTLVEWIEDPRPRDEEDLAHRSKVARVLVFRADSVARAAVKKYRLESEVYKGMGIGKYAGKEVKRDRKVSGGGKTAKTAGVATSGSGVEGQPAVVVEQGMRSSGSTHV
ncbi:hypothetical protein BCR44DRAFT_83623 [Catenaria anguillulae PL171]|uniref:Uncharacterized protein n=1 Tax=Catenaria anguillulae PL171 TaxID=765915 RepID=A0A1Y2HPB3_9FUNG|nr:hypothetical protein BCR44DRAFT_83623 [Catenaria anguillulae PL171]